MLPDLVRDLIRSEIEQIEDLFSQFGELMESSVSSEPDLVQRTALALACTWISIT